MWRYLKVDQTVASTCGGDWNKKFIVFVYTSLIPRSWFLLLCCLKVESTLAQMPLGLLFAKRLKITKVFIAPQVDSFFGWWGNLESWSRAHIYDIEMLQMKYDWNCLFLTHTPQVQRNTWDHIFDLTAPVSSENLAKDHKKYVFFFRNPSLRLKF